jgi:putative DNA primase/helicase
MPESDQNDAESLHTLAANICHRLGLRLTGALPAPGGGFKRLPETDGLGKERPGWLSIFADNQGGIAGNWKTGERVPFFIRSLRISALSEEERAARQAAVRRAQAAAETRRKADAEHAAIRAAKLWARGKPVPDDHPYLTGKGVAATPELRLAPWGEVILVPLRNVAGNLRSLQLIGAGGAKRFLRGGELRGHFWSIGVTGAAAKPTPLLICEGVSTGLTLHQATGLPVAAAMSWHNLSAAASALWAIA